MDERWRGGEMQDRTIKELRTIKIDNLMYLNSIDF